jgi:hypothetical protein
MARGTDEPLRPRRAHEEAGGTAGAARGHPGPQLGGRCHCSSIALSPTGASRTPAAPAARRAAGRGGAGGPWRRCAAPAPTRRACAWRCSRSSRSFPGRRLAEPAGAGPGRPQATRRRSPNPHPSRRRRLAEAVRQARAVAGGRVPGCWGRLGAPRARAALPVDPYTTADDSREGRAPAAPDEMPLRPPIAGSTATSSDP